MSETLREPRTSLPESSPARLATLIGLMAAVVLVAGGLSMFLLYDAAVDAQKARLLDAVRNHARLIEAVARYNAGQPKAARETAAEKTLSQVVDAHERSAGFGRTGEYVLAQRRADQIVFVLSHRHGEPGERHPEPLPIAGRLGAPMRRALGGASGAFVGIDYRGETVLAAYEPVAELNMGLVAKIDLSEIRAPFIHAAWLGGAVALLASFLSAYLFLRATMPLVHRVKETEAYNRTIVESAADGIMTVDLTGHITSFNPACARIFQCSEKDAVGRDVAQLLPEFEAGARARSHAGMTGKRADGAEVPLEVAVGELNEGTRRQLSLFIRDISERRRLESELRHAQKMEAIGTLASGIAHDFNNLLMGIASTTEVALKKAAGGAVAQHLARIKAAAVSGSSISRQLLTLGRSGAKAQSSVDLNSVVADVEHLLQHVLGTHIDLRVTLSPRPTVIRGDRGELEQILLNLAGNARHAMPSGGQLEITVSTDTTDAGDFAVLTVSDTGEGMSQETQRRAFEPFFTTKTDGSGTGLGLSSVYAIVRRHDGRVEVDSALGRGTTFRVFWPIDAAHSALPAAHPQGVEALRGNETVLLVEDEALVRESVREYLERSGYHVLVASGADEAMCIHAERAQDIDVLLTDIVLKGKSGPELATAFEGIPKLFMSAHPNELLVREGRLPQGTASLQKPFTETDLLVRLRAELSAASAKDVARSGAGDGCSLLLVEDDENARNACAELLSDMGYHVIATSSGAQALSAARTLGNTIDVVLTDMGLPDMSGTQLSDALRAELPGRPVIYLSGRDPDDEELSALLKHPHSGFAQKPIDLDSVVAMIEQLTTCPASSV